MAGFSQAFFLLLRAVGHGFVALAAYMDRELHSVLFRRLDLHAAFRGKGLHGFSVHCEVRYVRLAGSVLDAEPPRTDGPYNFAVEHLPVYAVDHLHVANRYAQHITFLDRHVLCGACVAVVYDVRPVTAHVESVLRDFVGKARLKPHAVVRVGLRDGPRDFTRHV